MTARERDRPPFPRIGRLAQIVLLALAIALGSGPALAADQTLELTVSINGASTGKIGEFVLRDGVLLARAEELGELGLRVSGTAPRTDDGLVVVSALRGVGVSLDPAAQTLELSAGPDQLAETVVGASPQQGPAAPLESSAGATLNYQMAASVSDGRHLASGQFDLRLFSPLGVASTDFLAHTGADARGAEHAAAIRLDSTYVYSDFAAQRRYRLGDFITGGLSWTRPVRFGGAQVTRDFSMRPDLVTFPLPVVAGSAAVPSTVDVLVNGSRVVSGQIPPGPFQVANTPVISGAGTVRMTVTDALGRQVTTTLPFYASPVLLAPGLQTYALDAGAVRRNWGLASNDYGAMAASATWRRGLSPSLTVEAHAEGTANQAMAGAGLVAEAFGLGVVNLSGSASSAQGRSGASLSVGAERQARRFSFGLSGVFATSGYRDIAAMNGDAVPVRQISANASVSLDRWGSAGVAYAAIERERPRTSAVAASSLGSDNGLVAVQAQDARVLTANYSVQVHHLFLYASGFHDFVRKGGDGVVIGLTLPLGPRSSVSVSGDSQSAPHAQIEAQQSADVIGDWGYHLFLDAGGAEHQFAQGQYKAPWALVAAGVDHAARQTTVRADIQGALSFLDGRLFASNLITDSFAVVDTGGVGGVPVLYENRDAGRTDSSGRRLVPDLRAFDVNHIAIDPTNLPADTLAATSSRDVRPPDRSGVVVRFAVRTVHAALVVLQDEAGRPIPVGATAQLLETHVTAPVGYDGEAFIEDLAPQNRLDVQLPEGGGCVVQFPFAPVKGDIPKLGPLTCRKAAP